MPKRIEVLFGRKSRRTLAGKTGTIGLNLQVKQSVIIFNI